MTIVISWSGFKPTIHKPKANAASIFNWNPGVYRGSCDPLQGKKTLLVT